MTARMCWAATVFVVTAIGVVPARAAGDARLVVTGSRSGTQTVRLGGTATIDPARMTIRGGGRVVVIYLSGANGTRAGVLAYRFDPRQQWSETVALGSAATLARGTYRLTLVSDAAVEVTFPLSGRRNVRVAPRTTADVQLASWQASTGADYTHRLPAKSAEKRLVVAGVRLASVGAVLTHTSACVTLPGSVCRAGGIRPTGGTKVAPGNGTVEAVSVYEPGDVTAGDYDAVIEAVSAGGTGTTTGFIVVAIL